MPADYFLAEADATKIRQRGRRYALSAACVLLLDCALSVALLLDLHSWSLGALQRTPVRQLLNFHHDGLDAVLLSLSRAVVLPLLALSAVSLATKPGTTPTGGTSSDTLREPLLPVSSSAPEDVVTSVAVARTPMEAVAALQAQFQADKRLAWRRNVCLALLFIACTGCSVTHAVKCVTFDALTSDSSDDAVPLRTALVRGLLLASGAMLAVVENALIAQAITDATAQGGVLRRDLHAHPLFYASDASIVAHTCDCCRARVTEGMRCAVCDFDCCLSCLVRRDAATAEGGIRSDAGPSSDGAAASPPPSAFFLRALKLVKSELPLFFLACSCLVATSIATLSLPNFTGRVLDYVFAGDVAGFKHNVFLLVCYSIASGAFGGLRSLCFSLVGRRLAYEVRTSLFRSLLAQDIVFYDAASVGDLTSRLSYDVQAMLAPVQTLLSSVLENAALLLGALAACFWQSWQLSLLAATTLMPATYVTQRYARWSSGLNRHIAAALGQGNAAATEALGHMRTVRSLSTEEAEATKFEGFAAAALACGVRDSVGGALAYALNNYLDLFTSALILWYGGILALEAQASATPGSSGHLTAGRLVTFQLYWGLFNSSFKALQSTIASFTRAAGSAQRVLSLLDHRPSIGPTGGQEPRLRHDAPPTMDIKLEEVAFTYQMRPNQPVLQGFSLHIPAQTTCALVGPSGGGKSTACHLLLRLYDPRAGRITVDGISLRDLDLAWMHRHTGVVAQDTQLFAASIEDNIRYGCPFSVSHEQVVEAAKAAHAHEFISSFGEGYFTRVGERGARLSGGQKQRLAIARALLRQPRLLLLDEATSSLDSEAEAAVQAAIDALVKQGGRTVILVAHRLSTVVDAHAIAVVEGGMVKDLGTHKDLLKKKDGLYSRLVARQLMSPK